jgi:hypothetical protein
MTSTIAALRYQNQEGPVSWQGYRMCDGESFDSFICDEVASRLYDSEELDDIKSHLRGLSLTGFGKDSLEKVLDASIPESRDWAVGEAIAEAWLSRGHGVIWPWNMERDKRNPYASLPGADLIGFINQGSETRIVLGEVKTSGETKYPPQVMTGRSGMKHQIDNLATDLNLINQLIRWLWPRCKKTDYESQFNASVKLYFNSGNKAVALFGILIRDTQANELDLKTRGQALGRTLSSPTKCNLIALYLPCSITELPGKVMMAGEEL